jgi:hypothetical protein
MNVTLAYLTVIAIWSTTPLAIRVSALDTGFAFALMVWMAIGRASDHGVGWDVEKRIP